MTEEQTSPELTILSQKKDDNLYIYYYRTVTSLIGISGRNRVIYNKENTIILNKAEQHNLKDTIAKFGVRLKIPELHLYMIEYRADPNCSFYKAFKKAEKYVKILNAKAKIKKKLKLKSGYKEFRIFQVSVALKQTF